MVYPLGTVSQQATGWQEVITASGTWTAPTVAANGFTIGSMRIEVIGPGGAGGAGSVGGGGGGGGGGAYGRTNAFAPAAGTGYAVTCAAGSATAFGTAATAGAGGAGGAASVTAAGTAGTAGAVGTGNVTFAGAAGTAGVAGATAAGGPGGHAAGPNGAGTAGGGGTLGFNVAAGGAGGAAGAAGSNYGGGGGGGAAPATAGAAAGAPIIVLTYNRQYGVLPTETATASDSVTRAWRGSRTVTHAAPATDSVVRLINYGRAASENIGPTPQDYKGLFPGFKINGVMYDYSANPLANVTAYLVRESDMAIVASQVTGSDGSYSFPRDTYDPYTYHVLGETIINGVQVHGTSDWGLTPHA